MVSTIEDKTLAYVIYNKRTGDVKEFGTAEKAACHMLGRVFSDHFIVKYTDGELDRVLQNPDRDVATLMEQLRNL